MPPKRSNNATLQPHLLCFACLEPLQPHKYLMHIKSRHNLSEVPSSLPDIPTHSSFRDRTVFREVFNKNAVTVHERYFAHVPLSRNAHALSKESRNSTHASRGRTSRTTRRPDDSHLRHPATSRPSTARSHQSDTMSTLSHDPSLTYYMPPDSDDDEDFGNQHHHQSNASSHSRTHSTSHCTNQSTSQWDTLMRRYKTEDARKAKILKSNVPEPKHSTTNTKLAKHSMDSKLSQLMGEFSSSSDEEPTLALEESLSIATPRDQRHHTTPVPSTVKRTRRLQSAHSSTPHNHSTSSSTHSRQSSTKTLLSSAKSTTPHPMPPKDRFSLHKSKNVTPHREVFVASPGTIQACTQGRFAFSQIIVRHDMQRLYLVGGMRLIGKKIFRSIAESDDLISLHSSMLPSEPGAGGDYFTDIADQYHNRVLTNSLLVFTPSSLKVRNATTVDLEQDHEWSWLTNGGKWEEICFPTGTVAPSPRAFHSVVEFDNKLYVYGGESIKSCSYESELQSREQLVRKKQSMITCSDFFVFDLKTKKWSLLEEDLRTIAQREEQERALLLGVNAGTMVALRAPNSALEPLDDLPSHTDGTVFNIDGTIQKKLWKDQDVEIFDYSPIRPGNHAPNGSTPHRTSKYSASHSHSNTETNSISSNSESRFSSFMTRDNSSLPHFDAHTSRLSSSIQSSSKPKRDFGLNSPSSRQSSQSSSTFSHNTTVITKSTTHNNDTESSSFKHTTPHVYKQGLSVKLPAVSTTFSSEEIGEDDGTTLTEGEVSSASFHFHDAENSLPSEYRVMAASSNTSISTLDDDVLLTENNSLNSSLYRDMGYSSPAFERLSSNPDDDHTSPASMTLSQERRRYKQQERNVLRTPLTESSLPQTSMEESFGETQTEDDEEDTYEEDDETCTTEVTTNTTSMLSHLAKAHPMEVDLSDIETESITTRSERTDAVDRHTFVGEDHSQNTEALYRVSFSENRISGFKNHSTPAPRPHEPSPHDNASQSSPSIADPGFNHNSLMASFGTSMSNMKNVTTKIASPRAPTSSSNKTPQNTNHGEDVDHALSYSSMRPPPLSRHTALIYYRQLYPGQKTYINKNTTNLVLYGGKNHKGEASGDVWLYNFHSQKFLRRMGPPPRHSHSACFDADRDRMIIFGGVSASETLLGDIWVHHFDNDTNRPVHFEVGPKPKPRAGHGAVFCKDQLFIFSGYDGKRHLSDCWVFNMNTCRWKEIYYSDAIPPRCFHSVQLLDEEHVVLLGGLNGKRIPLKIPYCMTLPVETEPEEKNDEEMFVGEDDLGVVF